ncbi:type II toxin-antitoxin system VapC family toxin [Denitratisoma sp. DHT3]|uniref:type II toxin-antitoxin system VapC family toxin n=1 Tax=Denitratisoma sp. DHT3 TaxID=1981880 RepID=UPI0016470994|nr:type II toxin-antitoxin system VapC family toxin [Denitratisoma sp. DHT3]
MRNIYVVDCSVSIAWLFDDQADAYTEAALDALVDNFAVVPGWWHVEMLNVLLSLERHGRIASDKTVQLLRHLQRLPVRRRESQMSVFELHALALRYHLTSYDALYLDSALATGLPLATRDKSLQRAAAESGIGVWSA